MTDSTMTIAKTFRWEMGHRLIDHPGGCRNLHGHSYRMEIEIHGRRGPDGMIIDFDDVARAVRPVLAGLDHAFLCEERDEDLLAFLRDKEMKYVVIAFPSTVENICAYIAERILPAFQGRRNVDQFVVRVSETETSRAELVTRVHPS
jgi:6-pyruvoyltetrahydropterin/6-carboxytetrahydropterin synthase